MQLTGPISTGQLASIGGTAKKLTTSQSLLNHGMYITAPSGNADTVYIGPAGVTTATGLPLAPGTTSPLIAVNDPTTIYIISAGTGDSVAWIGS